VDVGALLGLAKGRPLRLHTNLESERPEHNGGGGTGGHAEGAARARPQAQAQPPLPPRPPPPLWLPPHPPPRRLPRLLWLLRRRAMRS